MGHLCECRLHLLVSCIHSCAGAMPPHAYWQVALLEDCSPSLKEIAPKHTSKSGLFVQRKPSSRQSGRGKIVYLFCLSSVCVYIHRLLLIPTLTSPQTCPDSSGSRFDYVRCRPTVSAALQQLARADLQRVDRQRATGALVGSESCAFVDVTQQV